MTSTEKILGDLIAFPTVSRDSNLSLIRYIESWLKKHGILSVLTHNQEGTKANLYAVVGPGQDGGVMLSGHTDVVPVEGQEWTRDPFQMEDQNGRLYGRGTTDMKGFVASVLAMVPEICTRKLLHPIHFAFSYDEEIGCVGVRKMIDMLEGTSGRPGFCIVGEPTSMRVAIAHKGKTAANVVCHGVEAHSALASNGLNAIYLACELIGEIRDLQLEIARRKPAENEFDVPHTTLHVGTINGGTALNIIPNRCEFKFEIRNLEHDDPHMLLTEIRERADRIASRYRGRFPGVRYEIGVYNEYPALNTPSESEIVNFVRSLANTGDPVKIDFGTEGGLFQTQLKVPTVVCGPGSMDQGHKPDEYIERSELQRCDAFLVRLLDHLSE